MGNLSPTNKVVIEELRQPGALTWLHLSDIHFGEKGGAGINAVLNRLVDDVRKMREQHLVAPDLVFITGDVAFSGKKAEYQTMALPFLRELQQAAGVDASRVFVIPGNHDVDRKRIASPTLNHFQENLAGGNQDLIRKFLTEKATRLTARTCSANMTRMFNS